MATKTYDVLAYYSPSDKRRKAVVRHLAVMVSDSPVIDVPKWVDVKAFDGPANTNLVATVIVDRADRNHAEIMATVNYWADRPGVPA